MHRLWKYAENTFEVLTRRNFKLMHVILTDHRARCRQLKEEEPAEPLLVDAHDTAEGIYAEWQGAYSDWGVARGMYKGATLAFHNKLKELGSLKTRQWDAAIQTVFLEGTPEYVALLPKGRVPFMSGAYDSRLITVRALASTLEDYPALAALKAQVDEYLDELDALRLAQQRKETELDTCSAAVETQRQAAARALYKNLARFMLHWSETPVRIEDGFDMNYLRISASPPAKDAGSKAPLPPVA